jgi:hypothetical protein
LCFFRSELATFNAGSPIESFNDPAAGDRLTASTPPWTFSVAWPWLRTPLRRLPALLEKLRPCGSEIAIDLIFDALFPA